MNPKNITQLNKVRRKHIEDIPTEGKKELLAALLDTGDSDETASRILFTVTVYSEALCGDPDVSLSAGVNRVTGACEILGSLVPGLREDLLKVLAKAASDFACVK